MNRGSLCKLLALIEDRLTLWKGSRVKMGASFDVLDFYSDMLGFGTCLRGASGA